MTAVSDETVLKRNEVLSFDDGLLTIKISGHGAGDGWGSIAFHERQIEIDADGFHVAEIPPSELRALRDFLNRIIPAALSAAPVETWKCAARKQSLPEPADCGWPTCGCDPHADKVIAALEEQGHASPVAQEPVEPFGYLDRTGKFFVRADKSRDELLAAFKDAKIGTPCIKLYTPHQPHRRAWGRMR